MAAQRLDYGGRHRRVARGASGPGADNDLPGVEDPTCEAWQ
ncbi:MAG: hypothetical protein ABEI27_09190 [Halobellus sp.]